MTNVLDKRLPEMCATRCAICGREGEATERWPATLDADAFSASVFSARRLPDRVHYRMVTCNTCGLVRSDPVASEELLAMLYASSSFDYGQEVGSIRATYGRVLGWLEGRSRIRGALLEELGDHEGAATELERAEVDAARAKTRKSTQRHETSVQPHLALRSLKSPISASRRRARCRRLRRCSNPA